MTEPKAAVLPMYLVADESGSMKDVIHVVNSALTSLLDALHDEPLVAAKVRFGLVGFADDPQLRLPLSDLRQIERMPTLSAGGTTSYKAVFEDLRNRLPADVAMLKGAGYSVHRPAIFFLTDGIPNEGENWTTPLTALKDPNFRERPNLLAFGVGDSEPSIILQIASNPDYALVASDGVETGEALKKFASAFVQSIVSSGSAAASGAAQVVLERPEGFVLAMDLV